MILAEDQGLHVKWPTPVGEVNRLDARIQVHQLANREYLTEDKINVTVDSYCVWRISEPRTFLRTVTSQRGAEARLELFIASQLGSALGVVPFSSLVNVNDDERRYDDVVGGVAEATRAEAARYGIEVMDVRLQRLNFPAQNQNSVFERMRAERTRIAKAFRSEG